MAKVFIYPATSLILSYLVARYGHTPLSSAVAIRERIQTAGLESPPLQITPEEPKKGLKWAAVEVPAGTGAGCRSTGRRLKPARQPSSSTMPTSRSAAWGAPVPTVIKFLLRQKEIPKARPVLPEKRGRVEKTPMPKEIETAIRAAYKELNKRLGIKDTFVAVRSSATAEDLPDASFAGQQETFLNVKGADDLIDKVVKCWSSLFTPRAIFYRNEKGFPHEKVFISVGVQKMVNSGCAGVMFTINPVSGNRDEIVIEGNYGLGETVVSGVVNPDDFVIDKTTTSIKERRISRKTVEYIRDLKTGKTVHLEVPAEKQNDNLHRR